MREIVAEMDTMYSALHHHDNISGVESSIIGFPTKKEVLLYHEKQYEDNSLLEFLKKQGGFRMDWKMKDKDQTVKSFGGHLRILSLKSILGDWRNIVYFDFDAADSPKRNFKVVDFFTEEACVGFFVTDKKQLLYYHEFESEFYPLHLNFDGYFTMLLHSKAFWYWQKVLVEINDGISTPITQHFINCMTELFPEFDFQKYKNDYIQLKLNK